MRVEALILCEDVRSELGQKHTLIGVMDEISVALPPAHADPFGIRIALYFRARLEDAEVPDAIQITIKQGDDVVFSLPGTVPGRGPRGVVVAVLNMHQLVVPRIEALRFSVSVLSGGAAIGSVASYELPMTRGTLSATI